MNRDLIEQASFRIDKADQLETQEAIPTRTKPIGTEPAECVLLRMVSRRHALPKSRPATIRDGSMLGVVSVGGPQPPF